MIYESVASKFFFHVEVVLVLFSNLDLMLVLVK